MAEAQGANGEGRCFVEGDGEELGDAVWRLWLRCVGDAGDPAVRGMRLAVSLSDKTAGYVDVEVEMVAVELCPDNDSLFKDEAILAFYAARQTGHSFTPLLLVLWASMARFNC